jgi:hypothetical protein
MKRDLFAREALTQIANPTLQDRNPHSPTYGCFDRNLHTKSLTSSGMSRIRLAVGSHMIPTFPTTLSKTHDVEWVEGHYLRSLGSAHSDGSCDDYFLFEHAGGVPRFHY